MVAYHHLLQTPQPRCIDIYYVHCGWTFDTKIGNSAAIKNEHWHGHAQTCSIVPPSSGYISILIQLIPIQIKAWLTTQPFASIVEQYKTQQQPTGKAITRNRKTFASCVAPRVLKKRDVVLRTTQSNGPLLLTPPRTPLYGAVVQGYSCFKFVHTTLWSLESYFK
jgi:hypothetical protein